MRIKIVILSLLLFILATPGLSQQSQLGKVEFATSGSPQAQEYFLRGLAALHSFWYEEASEAFREATKIDPEFMMGYWGEAMALNHPLWGEQDTPAAKVVIAKIKDTPKLTARERAYLNAVKILYGEGEKHARDVAYAAAMEKIYRQYPDDLDAAAFYSLSLLGSNSDSKSYRIPALAGAIALEVYQRNPNHPGAAHYIIHAFDDPDHAILALPAARRYASIAPEAHHARHMPSHIFLQLGMWPEAAASNESAWEASDTWMKKKHLSASVRDYHSLHWLLYVYLQQGRYHKAEELLTLMKDTMSGPAYDNKLRPGYFENNFANMAAAFVIETERWSLAKSFFPANESTAMGSSTESSTHGGHGADASANQGATLRTSNVGRRLPVFVQGMARAMSGASSDQFDSAPQSIPELEVAALSASMRGDNAKATELMKKAVQQEEQLGPPSGPPGLIKPSQELFGEILLKAKKPELAVEQFNAALLRQPNRARSLLGLARALAKKGDRDTAVSTYNKFLEQWKDADPDLPELREARAYVK